MKAVFLGNRDKIFDIYTKESLGKLSEHIEIDMRVLTRNDVEKSAPVDCDFIFTTWGMPCFEHEEIVRFFPLLKAVFYAAGSVQSFARPFIELGIGVHSAWSANAVPVCEYCVSQILLANKGYFHSSAMYKRSGCEAAWTKTRSHIGNYGAKVGLLGLGMIGSMIAKELARHRVEVLAFDPFCTAERAKELGARLVKLEEIFSLCDTISNHLADNEQTKNIIGYNLLSKMKKGATLINTGRGAQIDETALVRLLEERPDLFAVLDVTAKEPLPDESPLLKLDNVVLTPHIAGSLGGEVARMGEYMVEAFLAYMNGDKDRCRVTAKMLETMA